MATITSDGRVIFTATLSSPPSSAQAHTDLLVDTGSHLTIIPDTLLSQFRGRYTTGLQIRTNVAGAVLEITGLTTEVEVEDHSRGSLQTVQSNQVLHAHSLNFAVNNPFLSGEGLLGMNVFDDVQADPVKDHAGTTAYLARRV